MDEMNNMNETTVMENENSVEVVPEENIQMIENEETSGIDPKLVLGAAVIAGAAIVGGIKHLKSKKNINAAAKARKRSICVHPGRSPRRSFPKRRRTLIRKLLRNLLTRKSNVW